MAKIAAVVVTYNRKELLLENINSLLNQTYNDGLDIVIIDNASSDGTAEAVLPFVNDKKIIYINTGSNLGGAGGFQYGVKYAALKKYDFVWLMDDDCIPEANALEEFMKFDNDNKGTYGFLSSKVLWKDGNICTMNIQRRKLTKTIKFKQVKDKPVNIVMASFVSLFIPMNIVYELGLPIKEFFIWTDDFEYTRRISRKYKCYLIPKSVVIHKSKNNVGANIATDDYERIDRYLYLYRNDVYLYRREGLRGFNYEIIRLTDHIIRCLFKAKNHRFKRISKIIKGTKNGFKFKPKIEYVNIDKTDRIS